MPPGGAAETAEQERPRDRGGDAGPVEAKLNVDPLDPSFATNATTGGRTRGRGLDM